VTGLSASLIAEIYQKLAELSVAAGGKTVTVYSLSTLPNSVASANLPARLLLPVITGEGGARQVTVMNTQNKFIVSWTLTDLLLYQPAAQGTGIAQVANPLVTYCADYLAALRLKIVGMGIDSITAEPDVYEYPQGSGSVYFGVRVSLTVKDII